MNPVLLQAAAPGGDIFSAMMPFLLIFAIFYLLVIRPQSKKQREHQDMLNAIDRGDTVVTSGGIHGKVTGVTDDVLTLEIAATKSGERIRIKTDRARIDRRVEAGGGEDS